MTRPTLKLGSTGSYVEEVQRILGLPIDGQFGQATESGVKSYQGAIGLAKDGVEPERIVAIMAIGDDYEAKFRVPYRR